MRTALSIIITGVALSACVGAPPNAEEAVTDDRPLTDSTVFTQTHVTFQADGTTRVEHRDITVAEERKRMAAQTTAAAGGPRPLTDRVDCDWDSIELFDQEGGTGNVICFSGRGTVHLRDYQRTVCEIGR